MVEISVILPIYNGEAYLYDSINSILKQTFRNFELLIIDDGSTDSSIDIVRSFKDERIRVFSFGSNQGLVSALNLGLINARGEYIARMDADDIAHPERFEVSIYFFDKNPEYSILGTRGAMSQETVVFKRLEKIDFTPHHVVKGIALINNPLIHSSVIFKRKLAKDHSLMYNSKFVHSEDNALWIDFMNIGAKVGIIEAPLIYHRIHADQVSSKFSEIQKINSCKKRVQWINEKYSCIIPNDFFQSYKALSFKEPLSSILDIQHLFKLYETLIYVAQNDKEICTECFRELLLNRMKTILYLNRHFGFNLFLLFWRKIVGSMGVIFGFKLIYYIAKYRG